MNKLNLSAKWIWTDNNKTPDARVVFRKTLELDAILAECIAYLAVDTKYWLYINGKQVVFEGGLFRESLKGCSYADRVDLAPFLAPGKNVISVLCWFYGNGGRNNTDAPVRKNAWYYMVLEFMQFMAEELADHRFDEFIEMRRASLKENFEKTFWNGQCFASSDFVDDRANALAVLASLCGPEKYEAMRYILLTTFNSTVYMENYVLLALCRMGYVEDAYHRMVSRYTNLALNENSTLWEDFFILGSRNHAWTGAPITIAYQYFMGIDTNDGFETMTVTPNKTLFKKMACTVNGKDGLIHMKVDNVAGRVTVINGSKTRVTVQY